MSCLFKLEENMPLMSAIMITIIKILSFNNSIIAHVAIIADSYHMILSMLVGRSRRKLLLGVLYGRRSIKTTFLSSSGLYGHWWDLWDCETRDCETRDCAAACIVASNRRRCVSGQPRFRLKIYLTRILYYKS